MRALIVVTTLPLLTSLLCAENPRVLAAAAGNAPAERTVSGPSLGVVAGESTGVRLVRGVPGAATMGERLNIPALSTWAVSPDRNYLIGVTATTHRLILARNLGRDSRVTALARWGLRAPLVVLSPTGASAAVFDAGLKRIVVWKGLPAEPVLAWSRDSNLARAELDSMAVRDDGERVLTASAGSITEFSRQGESRHMAAIGGAGIVAYLAESEDILYVDGGAKSTMLLQDGAALLLAGAQDGITSPLALAASTDGRSVLVGNQDPPGVVVVDRTLGTVTMVSAPRSPVALERLAGGSHFQLTRADDGAVYVLSVERDSPRLTFIPPPVNGDEGGAR